MTTTIDRRRQANPRKRPRAVLEFSRRRRAPRRIRANLRRLQRGKRQLRSHLLRRTHRYFKAIWEGERGFDAIAVVTDTDTLTPPCGACRQIIWEFCGDVPVVLSNLKGKVEYERSGKLLPRAFDAGFL